MEIVALVTLVVSVVWWVVKRRAAKADDPVERNRVKYVEIDREILRHGKEDRESAALAGDLDELERLQRAAGDPSGPGGDQAAGGGKV